MTILAEVLTDALGLPHTDSRVQTLMESLGLGTPKFKLKRGDFDIGFSADAHGVDLNFFRPVDLRRPG